MDDAKLKLEKFDGCDFGFWRMQIEDMLYQRKLHQPLFGTRPEGMSQEDWTLLDRQALGVVRLTLTKNVAFNIMGEKTTAGVMKALADMYEKPSAVNKVHLMKKLFNLRMGESSSAAEHINGFNLLVSQLSSVDIDFDDEVRALCLLSSLPESWSGTVTAVSSSYGSTKLKYSDVRDLILSEDIRRRDSGVAQNTSLLSAQDRGRSARREGHRGPSRSLSRRPGGVCWRCGEAGHIKRYCPQGQSGHGSRQDSGSVNSARDDPPQDALVLSADGPTESWILDSGASFHSTSRKELFSGYAACDGGKVCLANGELLDVVGVGSVNVKTGRGTVWALQQVRHVPGLKRNLISVAQLGEEGCMSTFDVGSWKVTKGARILARGSKDGTRYITGAVGATAGTCAVGATAKQDAWDSNKATRRTSVKWELPPRDGDALQGNKRFRVKVKHGKGAHRVGQAGKSPTGWLRLGVASAGLQG